MARMGMDVEKVHEAGRQLKAGATDIAKAIAAIESSVNHLSSVWDGPDAKRFVHEWWPQHKKELLAAQQHIDGLGQSALNNESEQRHASAADSAGGASATHSRSLHEIYQDFKHWGEDTAVGNVVRSIVEKIPGVSSGLDIADDFASPDLSGEDKFAAISADSFKAIGQVGVAVGAALAVGALIAGAPVAAPALIIAGGIGAVYAGNAMAVNNTYHGGGGLNALGDTFTGTAHDVLMSGFAGATEGIGPLAEIGLNTGWSMMQAPFKKDFRWI
ncbi:hypothetical protein [Smaragdicoccus niigatensis]|uniref:hypothetical protein n=1 Tax=Smaragdicoccus niigatensis TaxID=359359 RepID=UPI00039C9634|nr:hypothetical protein [Smaragdicoccus niigatensis]